MSSSLKKLYWKLPVAIRSFVATVYGYKMNHWRRLNRAEYLETLRKRDQWTKAEWEKWQQAELKSILDYAVKHVPYYKRLWENIHRSEPGKDHLELTNWPILEKEALRSNPEDFLSDEFKKEDLYNIHTSGTTGKPLSIWFSREAMSWWYAMYEYRIKIKNGVSDQHRWANIGGQLICPVEQEKPPFWVWNAAMKQLYCSSYHIKPENIAYYLSAFKKYKIDYLLGYVSSIYNIARVGLEKGLEFPPMKLVITNAEPLLKHQREVIEKAFKCKAVQTYSGSECAFAANEDLNESMNLWPESGIMEVVDASDQFQPKGVRGEFVATAFANRAMPLIRFRTGDSGAFNETTGAAFDSLKEITGRTDDLVYTTDGKMVGRLDPVFKADLHIREAQIIQLDLGNITVKLVPTAGYSEEDADYIRNAMKERVGDQMNVTIETVPEIPKGPNGKFKAVVSMVKKV